MAKFANEIDRTPKTGFCNMDKKWDNLGKPRKTVGGKKTEIPMNKKIGMV